MNIKDIKANEKYVTLEGDVFYSLFVGEQYVFGNCECGKEALINPKDLDHIHGSKDDMVYTVEQPAGIVWLVEDGEYLAEFDEFETAQKIADMLNSALKTTPGALKGTESKPPSSEIQWEELLDGCGNSYWEGASPYHVKGTPVCWRIKQRLISGKIEWYSDNDAELGTIEYCWGNLEDAKADCQENHDNILFFHKVKDDPKEDDS